MFGFGFLLLAQRGELLLFFSFGFRLPFSLGYFLFFRFKLFTLFLQSLLFFGKLLLFFCLGLRLLAFQALEFQSGHTGKWAFRMFLEEDIQIFRIIRILNQLPHLLICTVFSWGRNYGFRSWSRGGRHLCSRSFFAEKKELTTCMTCTLQHAAFRSLLGVDRNITGGFLGKIGGFKIAGVVVFETLQKIIGEWRMSGSFIIVIDKFQTSGGQNLHTFLFGDFLVITLVFLIETHPTITFTQQCTAETRI